MDKAPVKVAKAEEGLNILHFMRLRPIQDRLDLVLGHMHTIRQEDKTEILNGVFVEFTFLCTGKKTVCA